MGLNKHTRCMLFWFCVYVAVVSLSLADGNFTNIKLGNGRTCRKGEFHCQSDTCIDLSSLCDGRKDCNDGSDETAEECESIVCPIFTFRCNYGACIARGGHCNGTVECADGSDEMQEHCKSTTPRPFYGNNSDVSVWTIIFLQNGYKIPGRN